MVSVGSGGRWVALGRPWGFCGIPRFSILVQVKNDGAPGGGYLLSPPLYKHVVNVCTVEIIGKVMGTLRI